MTNQINYTDIDATATVQFGNPTDSSGYCVKEAQILTKREGGFVTAYLVKDGDLYGVATIGRINSVEAEYYCTMGMRIGDRFSKEDVAHHLGFPVSYFN